MSALLPLLGVWLFAIVTPGPDFLVTAQYATSRSRRQGVLVGVGVSTAMLVWATGSMLGLSVLLARISWLYDLVRLAGAAYLGYLGVRTLWRGYRERKSPPHLPTGTDSRSDPDPDPGSTPAPPPGSRAAVPMSVRHALRAWRVGFLTNIGNPKAAVFFGSLLGALLPAHATVTLRIEAVAAMVAMAAVWFTIVATVFGIAPVARAYRRSRRWIDRIMAAVFIALGGRLALDR
jgi:threonine efflux protein